MMRHPLRKNRTPAAHDSCNALGNHRQVLDKHAGMNGHVVHALLCLFLNHFEHHFGAQIFDPFHSRNSFIDRHSSDRNRRVSQDRLADFMDIAAGREVHHRVGAKVDSRV